MEQAERKVQLVEEETRKIDVLDERINNLNRILGELGTEVSALRRAILTASLSFAGSALLIAATVYLVFK